MQIYPFSDVYIIWYRDFLSGRIFFYPKSVIRVLMIMCALFFILPPTFRRCSGLRREKTGSKQESAVNTEYSWISKENISRSNDRLGGNNIFLL